MFEQNMFEKDFCGNFMLKASVIYAFICTPFTENFILQALLKNCAYLYVEFNFVSINLLLHKKRSDSK